MQDIEVFDNFFTEDIREEIHNLLLGSKWGPDGGNSVNWFWHMDDLEKDEYFNTYLFQIICKKLNRFFEIKRIYANGQTAGQCGNPHVDGDCGITLLYYPNPEWRINYQGNLIFSENGEDPTHIIGYKPNRAVLFPANIVHYADAPHRFYTGMRISLAYKLWEVLNENE